MKRGGIKNFWGGFVEKVRQKYMGIEERFVWLVGVSKPRLLRVVRHFGRLRGSRGASAARRWQWWADLGWYVLDLVALPDVYEAFASILKYNTRPLNDRELALGLSVFGESLNFDLVRVDERAFLGTRRGGMVYVSFHTINSWGAFSDDVLVHELMHIWQYERYGAVYIGRSLAAQRTPEGYNYGGLDALRANQMLGLQAFNFEQQADIVADSFRVKMGLPPRWGRATGDDLAAYAPYIAELQVADEDYVA